MASSWNERSRTFFIVHHDVLKLHGPELKAYGIAVYHLFDIDLRLKWTLERGTMAAAFIAVFFVVSEGAATILSDRLGTLAGLFATGVLVFALASTVSINALPTIPSSMVGKSYVPAFRSSRSRIAR